jgi:pescadillo protein
MARIKKKGKAGQAKNYITRSKAVRKLQVTLPDFRRLCIFKGIYPRQPRNIKKANKSATHSTTFYYTKDIQYLLHEPLLVKFREQKALQKKIARSLGRNEVQDAMRLEKQHTPKIKLDHIVRERYLTFVDALRDLDDALSLLFLFSSLPSTTTVPPKVIARCQRLCHEFEHYLITSHSLKKSFLSIKGIYYQATIQGQDIMWLVPYRFVQRVSGDVDYRIMGTFVEFYCTLLGFVNYRLYTSIGLVYPPKFDTTSDERGAELAAFTLQGRNMTDLEENRDHRAEITNGHSESNNAAVQLQVEMAAAAQEAAPQDEQSDDQYKEVEASEGVDRFEVTAPDGDTLPQPEINGDSAATLFSNLTVFISREAPRHAIEFLLRSFGCKRIAWDAVLGEGAFTHDETNPMITHQIVDRPAVTPPQPAEDENANNGSVQSVRPGYVVPGRIYIQPQWIWDCVNEGNLLRTDIYSPGATLPPHLSPWVKPTSGQYDPRATLEDQELEGEADEDESLIEDSDEGETQALEEMLAEQNEEDAEGDGGMEVALSEEDSSEGEEINSFDGFGDDDKENEEQEDDEEALHQRELEAEATGKPVMAKVDTARAAKDKARKARDIQNTKEAEDIERRKMMMSNKKRKLYEKMQYGNEKKDAEAATLRKKRRRLERQG